MILGHVTEGHGVLLWVEHISLFLVLGSKTDFLLGMV
jgi:hypothetical protein